MTSFFTRRGTIILASCFLFFVLLAILPQPRFATDAVNNLFPVSDTDQDSIGTTGDDANSGKPPRPMDKLPPALDKAPSGSGESMLVMPTTSSPHALTTGTSTATSMSTETMSSSATSAASKSPVFVGSTNPNKGKTRPEPFGDVGKVHLLVPASNAEEVLCYNLASAAALRYMPVLIGWNATDEFSAAKLHLNKLKGINRYFNTLPKSDDDDLVVIVDGYDVIMQLPIEIMVERYFEIRDAADERLAKRFGVSVEEARKNNIRQTMFWGPDKLCWPIEWKALRCWAVPSGLSKKAFGPKTGDGNMDTNDPRWLNSGTVIGPLKDLRRYISAALEEIEMTWDPKFAQSYSDQFYLANIWGRQEYYRSLKANGGERVKGGPDGREEPDHKYDSMDHEFHVSVDYESALFQTVAGYERWIGELHFDRTGLSAYMGDNLFDLEDDWETYNIYMPANVASSITRLYNRVPHLHRGLDAVNWLRQIRLGVNLITKHIWVLWHCTGPKDPVPDEWRRSWFYPYARSLLKSAIDADWEEPTFLDIEIDNRVWTNKYHYPDDLSHELGGFWSDYNNLTFIPWHEVCGDYDDVLFKGEETLARLISADDS